MGMKARRKPNKVDALKRHVKKLLKELEGDLRDLDGKGDRP